MVLGVNPDKHIYPQQTIFTNLLFYYVIPIHTFYDILIYFLKIMYFSFISPPDKHVYRLVYFYHIAQQPLVGQGIARSRSGGTAPTRSRSCDGRDCQCKELFRWNCPCKEPFLRWKGLSVQEVEVGLSLQGVVLEVGLSLPGVVLEAEGNVIARC